MATKAGGRKRAGGILFKPFNQATLEATSAAWKDDAQKGEGFLPEIEQAMNWVGEHLELKDNEMAYGVFHEKDPVAVAICETAITKPSIRGKWVKLLRLRLRPQVEGLIFNNDPEGTTIALNAYVSSVIGVYHVKNVHEATTIKIYGRTQEHMRFLTLFSEALKLNKEATFNAEIQGRWLVLNWGKK
jgi:hypothetical protein